MPRVRAHRKGSARNLRTCVVDGRVTVRNDVGRHELRAVDRLAYVLGALIVGGVAVVDAVSQVLQDLACRVPVDRDY